MRGMRSFLALLVVAVGFGAYLYFVESKRDPTETADKKDKVFTVEAEKIDELTIKSESGDRTTIRKSGTEWKVVEPAASAANADATEVSGITMNLATLEQQRVIEEQAADLGPFGLAKPRIEVSFKADGQTRTLQLGSKTPTGGDIYAKLADQPKVFIIASYLESTFNRTTFDLRDKTVLKVDAATVDAMEVTTAGGTKRFEKKGDAWHLVSPAETRVDSFAIDNVVSRVLNAQMKTLAPSIDLAGAGLDKPAATARVRAGSGQATLLVGRAAEDGSVYAKDESRPEIFTIESAVLDELNKPAVEFRQKDLFDARSFNTTKVEIARGGQTWTVAKDQKDKEEKLNAFLTTVTGARADSFVDTAPATKPEITVTLMSEGKQERVTFAKSGSDGFAMRDGTAGAAKIPATLVDDIVKAAEALK